MSGPTFLGLPANLERPPFERHNARPRAADMDPGIRRDLTGQAVAGIDEAKDLATLRKNAGACRKAGIRLAADDVGSGNAGLRLLTEIHFDIVKIDLSLVQGGVLHDPSHAVLRALQELASRWKATVVAIRELGISAGQGYLLGRPGPERHAEPLDIEALLPADWEERSRPSAA